MQRRVLRQGPRPADGSEAVWLGSRLSFEACSGKVHVAPIEVVADVSPARAGCRHAGGS